jgi:nitric oxide reductase activation protein
LAKRLEGIRDQTLQRLRFQDQGKLDRRRMIAAVKGSKDVRVQYQEQPATSFAASIALDMSGSMKDHIAAGRLFDSTMVLSDTFEQLEIPYEIRGFGTGEAQYKTMDDPQADLERTGHLVGRSLGGTHMANTAGLATTSLMARPEKNRLFVSLTDGALSDHDDAMAQMHYARKQGIVTYGVFLGPNPDQTKMDEIYGPGNWTAINELSDLPDVVGKRLGVLFNKIR